MKSYFARQVDISDDNKAYGGLADVWRPLNVLYNSAHFFHFLLNHRTNSGYTENRIPPKIKAKKDCLWKQRTHKFTKIGDSV